MAKEKQTKSRKMSRQQKNDYVKECMQRGLRELQSGRCTIRIPQDKLTSGITTDVLTAITQALLAKDKLPEIDMNWPDTAEIGALLQTRIRTCMQNVLEAADALVCQMQVVLDWLNDLDNTQQPSKRHTKRDAKGRFTKK